MSTNRLELLYRRPLATDSRFARQFPTEHAFKRELKYFPSAPTDFAFDILEIGPGHGEFLFHIANLYPEKKILAVEMSKTRFDKISENITRRGLKNITLIGGDVRQLLQSDTLQKTFSRIYVLFPDPWPRNRHRHKRLLQTTTFEKIFSLLQPGGIFTLATDVKDYASWAAENSKIFTKPSPVGNHPLPDLIPTYFETKWREMGRDFYYLRLTK